MKSDAVRIAESQERARISEAVRDVLVNPALDVIAGILLIEYYQGQTVTAKIVDAGSGQSYYEKRRIAGGGWVGSAAGSAAEAGLLAYLVAPSLVQTSKQLSPLIQSLAPLIAKV